MKLYRILRKTTNSVQPSNTYWQTEVLYCGYDRLEAIRVFHESRPRDYCHGYGNSSVKTVGQSKEVKEDNNASTGNWDQ
jgi:acyl-coenzyme A synthetase/AMP-(fatty) acid ligase